MSRGAIEPLSATAVEKLKGDGKTNRRVMVGGEDCAGLHLRIEGASKSWALRYKLGERRRDIGLGPYNPKKNMTDAEAEEAPGMTLFEARNRARVIRRMIRKGIDPIEQQKAEAQANAVAVVRKKTFKECAAEFLKSQEGEWENSNAKHVKQWSATLETYAYPLIGELPIDAVNTDDVLRVLKQDVETKDGPKPMWDTKNETASRLRGRIERILGWATFHELRSGHNPARFKGHLDNDLTKRGKLRKVEHHAAMDYADVGAFMVELAKRSGTAARGLEFAILTAARSGEVRGATWDEIDLDKRLWTVPADRMKAGKEHVVPLSDAAVAILQAMPRMKGSNYVFPAPRGGTMSDMTLGAVLKRMGRKDGVTVHGFRSTFREWVADRTNYPREVAEHALAHQLPDKVEASYQRRTQLPKRAKLMADWATYCSTVEKPGGNVVAIKGAA